MGVAGCQEEREEYAKLNWVSVTFRSWMLQWVGVWQSGGTLSLGNTLISKGK